MGYLSINYSNFGGNESFNVYVSRPKIKKIVKKHVEIIINKLNRNLFRGVLAPGEERLKIIRETKPPTRMRTG